MHMDEHYQMRMRIVQCSCYLTGRIIVCMKTSNYAKKWNDSKIITRMYVRIDIRG